MKNKLIFTAAIAICLIVALCGCSGDIGGGAVPDDAFKPAIDDGVDSELYARYKELEEIAGQSFSVIPDTDGACFEVEEVVGGVKLIEYTGDHNIVVIPESIGGKAVVGIGKNAFADKNMRAIYIPDGVEAVDMGALDGCDAMLTLRIPKLYGGFLGYIFGADEYAENAMATPKSLDTVILGDRAGDIAENAFSGCKNLSAVSLSDSTKKIGKFAFYECSDLVYIDLGGVESIGTYAFASCQNLYAADCADVKSIELGAFEDCRSMNSITLSVIGDSDHAYLGYIFGAESRAYSANYVPSALRTVELTDKCEVIPPLAFAGCERITSVILSEGIKEIGTRAFYRCRSMTKIELPESVISVGADAFFNCDLLREVKFKEGLTSLGMQAFFGCSSLEAIELPDTLKEIKPSAFYGCKALKTVDLGGVKTIGKDAFWGCSSLQPITADGVQISSGNEALTSMVDGESK